LVSDGLFSTTYGVDFGRPSRVAHSPASVLPRKAQPRLAPYIISKNPRYHKFCFFARKMAAFCASVMAGLVPIGAKFRDSQLESIVIQAGDGCADV
jgi:hypothetical protein